MSGTSTTAKAGRAAEYSRMADLIQRDPEWFQDDSIDDSALVEGLRLAATAPDLVKALEDLRALCRHADKYAPEHFAKKVSDKIDAALAAAKGAGR